MRGKTYRSMREKIGTGKLYPLSEAIDLAKRASYAKFDGSIELHIRLTGRKPDDRQLRARVSLPHGIGKSPHVVVLDDRTIEDLAKSGTAPADIYLATPELMPKVAKIAKILGPKGKMPNPTSGTVTDKTEERAKELASDTSAEVRTDPTGIIHTGIGKVSWETAQLVANAEVVLRAIPRTKIGSVTIAATMGPGVRVSVSSLT